MSSETGGFEMVASHSFEKLDIKPSASTLALNPTDAAGSHTTGFDWTPTATAPVKASEVFQAKLTASEPPTGNKDAFEALLKSAVHGS